MFDIAEKDIGRHVRRKSTGEIGIIRREGRNGLLHPTVDPDQWEGCRDDLEYVEIVAVGENEIFTEDRLRHLIDTLGMEHAADYLEARRKMWAAISMVKGARCVVLEDALKEYDRLSLVISSAVHWSDPTHDKEITAAILSGREALGLRTKKKEPESTHEFKSDLGSEFCDVCGRSCIGHEWPKPVDDRINDKLADYSLSLGIDTTAFEEALRKRKETKDD
jgi:hypothetical protein